jgi:hypothetical protein
MHQVPAFVDLKLTGDGLLVNLEVIISIKVNGMFQFVLDITFHHPVSFIRYIFRDHSRDRLNRFFLRAYGNGRRHESKDEGLKFKSLFHGFIRLS